MKRLTIVAALLGLVLALPGGASARSSANSVYVVFRNEWQFVIDHVRQLINIKASCRYIGSNKDTNFA